MVTLLILILGLGASQALLQSKVAGGLFTTVIVVAAMYGIYIYAAKATDLKIWAHQNELNYAQQGMRAMIDVRLASSPGKHFFNARSLIKSAANPAIPLTVGGILSPLTDLNPAKITGPVAYGTIENRPVWIWPLVVQLFGVSVSKRPFLGWCFELSTHTIPVRVLVTRKFIGSRDTLDTESTSFEKLYEISGQRDHSILQLLDPVMMELILHSQISALEFSDRSVVLYHTIPPPRKETLDTYLYWGIKIAEQVDRNFPIG